LIIKHTPQKTIGVILNKKEITTKIQIATGNYSNEETESEIAEAEEIEEEEPSGDIMTDYNLLLSNSRKHVYYGGSVSGTVVLHTRKNIPKSHSIGNGLYYNVSTISNSKLIRHCNKFTKNYRVFLGYAEWHPSQLTSELENGWWFLARCPPSLLFSKKSIIKTHSTPKKAITEKLDLTSNQEMWSKVLRLMGGEFYHFSHASSTEKIYVPKFIIEQK